MAIEIIIILVLLGIVALLFPDKVRSLIDFILGREPAANKAGTNSRKEQTPPPYRRDDLLRRLETETGQLRNENIQLRQRLNSLAQAFDKHKTDCDAQLTRLSNEVVTLRSRQTQIVAETRNDIESLRRVVSPVPSDTSGSPVESAPPSPAYPEVKYTRFLDNAKGGFRQNELTDSPDNSIFEIVIRSAQSACFHLVPDKAMRSQLFSMLNNVVTPACDITVVSNDPADIVDVSDGELELDGDIWILRKKASIKLV